MTDQIGLILALAAFSGMISIPLVVLLVRSMNELHRVSGGAHRESDRERRDMYDMLMRLIENQSVKPEYAMGQHATERMERMSLETSLQREEMKNERAVGPPPASAGGVVDDVTLSID